MYEKWKVIDKYPNYTINKKGEIKRLYGAKGTSGKHSQAKLAEKYGVDPSTISDIKTGVHWNHI